MQRVVAVWTAKHTKPTRKRTKARARAAEELPPTGPEPDSPSSQPPGATQAGRSLREAHAYERAQELAELRMISSRWQLDIVEAEEVGRGRESERGTRRLPQAYVAPSAESGYPFGHEETDSSLGARRGGGRLACPLLRNSWYGFFAVARR